MKMNDSEEEAVQSKSDENDVTCYQHTDGSPSENTTKDMKTNCKTAEDRSETLGMQLKQLMRINDNDTQMSNCADSVSLQQARKSINGDEAISKVPEIKVEEIESTFADKTRTVPCRQLPGSPDMSPVTRRRRTVLAKKALELEKDGKITRLRVYRNSVILEFRDKLIDGTPDKLPDGCRDKPTDETDESLSLAARRGSRDDISLIWKRYKSPRSERRRTVPPIKLGVPEDN